LKRLKDSETYWINKNGEIIYYDEMEEIYSKNLLRFLDKNKIPPSPKLIERVGYFDSVRKNLKTLF
jgi:hypothetical protein